MAFQPTQVMKEKAESAKAYIERKYAKLKYEEKEKKEGKNHNNSNVIIAWDKLLK